VLALCVVAFLLEKSLVRYEPLAQQQVPLGVLFGPLVVEGQQWFRLLTTVFTHGGILHLVLNMSVLWTLGFTLERAVGSARFAAMSLVCALGASGTVMLLAFDQPTVGASGMILGYAGVMLPISTKQGRSQLLTWLVQIAIISMLPNISWQGHLGGFLWGLPCGLALKAGPKTFRLAAPALVVLAAVFAVLAANASMARLQ
jgi:rhomboid protease GluP